MGVWLYTRGSSLEITVYNNDGEKEDRTNDIARCQRPGRCEKRSSKTGNEKSRNSSGGALLTKRDNDKEVHKRKVFTFQKQPIKFKFNFSVRVYIRLVIVF